MARFRHDPHGFLDEAGEGAILDEIQNVPEVFNFVRARIDRHPERRGRWLLTGSHDLGLMRKITESMAGRAAILQLLPFSARETPKVGLRRGGFPEALARPQAAKLWFSSYLQTLKSQLNHGRRRELYYFRDQQGLEVDFVVPGRNGSVRLVEAKATRTATPDMAGPMRRLAEAFARRPGPHGRVEQFVVHRPARAATPSRALAPGAQAVPWPEFVQLLAEG